MAYSKVTIVFSAMPNVGNTLSIDDETTGIILAESFRTNRLGVWQVKIPQFTGGKYVGYISDNYRDAFNLDYNSSELYTVTSTRAEIDSGLGTVIIEATSPNWFFINPFTNASGVTITIENEVTSPEITIDAVSFTQASTVPCQNVKVNVTTNHLATKIISPVSVNPNSANPFNFDWLRGETINIIVEDSNGNQASQEIVLPSILNASNFIVTVNNSPNGATVIVTNVNSNGLELEYSLDNTTWQTSNIFTGLDVGEFTLYVKDQLGCSFTKNFEVNEFGIYSPFFYISKSNSIRYANRITWGDSANYKTDENTLSCEVDVDQVYREVQQFQSADIIKTQFKSNYSSNVAKIIKEDLTEINIPIEKKSNNIGIKDKRDARQYNLGNDKTGIYFAAGNIYDYDTNTVTGTHALNGDLPEWAVVGNYIVISGAWYLIEETVYDENKDAEVIVISQIYTGSEISIVAGSIYNRFNYEVYEFTIDMVNYIDQHFQVKLINSDPNFTTITHLSEEIWCKVKHDDIVEIRYFNTTNTDVFYATGIEFKIRVPLTIQKGKIDEESEVHKTDTNSILLSAEMYEVDEFIFEPVTKEIWRKIMIALSHEKVWINGVGYVKNGAFSTEGPLEKSNLYVLTATMIKTGSVYNSQGTGNLDFNGSEVEVPGLISTDTGFVSYI